MISVDKFIAVVGLDAGVFFLPPLYAVCLLIFVFDLGLHWNEWIMFSRWMITPSQTLCFWIFKRKKLYTNTHFSLPIRLRFVPSISSNVNYFFLWMCTQQSQTLVFFRSFFFNSNTMTSSVCYSFFYHHWDKHHLESVHRCVCCLILVDVVVVNI